MRHHVTDHLQTSPVGTSIFATRIQERAPLLRSPIVMGIKPTDVLLDQVEKTMVARNTETRDGLTYWYS